MAFIETALTDVGMKQDTPVPGHAPGYLPAGKTWKLVWHDEFDGDALDESVWNYRLNFWGYKSPTFTTEGVVLDGNSHMQIRLVRHGDDFYSAHLQTGSLTFDLPRDPGNTGFWPFGTKKKPGFMHRYGYYEICCRLPAHSGWHAAFWLQAPGIGSHPDPRYAGVECDIMENYNQHTTGRMICGCGWGGYGAEGHWYGHYSYPYEETADGWHRYGVDWSEDGYVFYADGKMVGKQMAPKCAVSHVEQFLLISTECHGYHRVFTRRGRDGEPEYAGKPVAELFDAYPDCFEIDYVRVYDAIPAVEVQY